MLQPKRTKFRKQMTGHNRGLAHRGSKVSFGEFALKAAGRGRSPCLDRPPWSPLYKIPTQPPRAQNLEKKKKMVLLQRSSYVAQTNDQRTKNTLSLIRV